MSYCIEGVAAGEAANDKPRQAAQFWDVAEALRNMVIITALSPSEQAGYERYVAIARPQLDGPPSRQPRQKVERCRSTKWSAVRSRCGLSP